MEKPEEVNGVLIVQTGGGTNQIGRFEIEVDDDTNGIASWAWRTDPIDSTTVQPDPQLEAFIAGYQDEVDEKYSKILGHLASLHTHPRREIETALGNLTADAIAERSRADVVLMGSGSIRSAELGPVVTLGTFMSCYPYDDVLLRYTLQGDTLRRAFERWMRPENRTGEGECYQVNAGVQATWDEVSASLVSLHIGGEPVDDEAVYTVALQGFHAQSAEKFLGLSPADLTAVGEPTTVATSVQDVLRAFFEASQNASRKVEGRLVYQA
jgi:5'-nucleotidase / UDP-sugar diphosphatase